MRILIADDHPAFRDALDLYLRRDVPEAAITSAGSLGELDALFAAMPRPAFDLVLLDWFLPDGEGADESTGLERLGGQGMTRLAAAGVEMPVIVLSGDTDDRTVLAALSGGAKAFLPKTLSRAEIVAAIRLVLAGGTMVPADIALRLASAPPPASETVDMAVAPQLTPREAEVLSELATGATNKEIGRRLDLQVTVKLHTRHIMRKLSARNRTDAVMKARDRGLIAGGELLPGAPEIQ